MGRQKEIAKLINAFFADFCCKNGSVMFKTISTMFQL